MIVGETRRLQGRTSVKTFEKMRMCATSIKSDGTTRGGEGGGGRRGLYSQSN